MTLTSEELNILIQVLNQPKQMDLQTAQRLIQLSNKITTMLNELKVTANEPES